MMRKCLSESAFYATHIFIRATKAGAFDAR